MQRRLSAILCADVVGYSGLMEADEAGTLERLKANRSAIFNPHVAIHNGRVFKLMGDGALVEFSSAIAAVNCALAIQEATDKAETDLPEATRIRYRIGINLGEVIVEGEDIYGEGVNVAARLQALASVSGVIISRIVRDQVDGKAPCVFEDMGEHTVKNIERPVHVFAVRSGSANAPVAVAKRTERLLAVLAFDNLSGDPEMAYFSDGISEEILQTVAQGAGMKVVARSSSFQFRGANKAIRNVAAELKTTHVLDGSVRRSGSRVRISASLVECAGQTTLWSDRFDRELSDVFALQDEIAAAISNSLKLTFAPTSKAETVDPAAYNLYLKALETRNKGLETGTRLAVIKMLETATELAPKFARAWVLLATVQAAHFRFEESERPDIVLHNRTIRAAETALKLDPGLGAAYQAMGQLEPYGRYEKRESLHQKALAVAPNDPAVLTNASLFYVEVGRIQEALGYAKRSYDLDPMSPWTANWYAAMLGIAGQFEDCAILTKRLLANWPDNELIAWTAASLAITLEDWTWFDDLARNADEMKFNSRGLRGTVAVGRALRDPDREAQAAHFLERAQNALSRTGFVPIERYPTLYKLGLKDEIFELIERISFAFMFDPEVCSPDGSMSDGFIFNAPYNGPMMQDVRFVRLCAKLGLCDYWVNTDRWPDCAVAVAPFYDFKAEAKRLVAAGPIVQN